MTARVFFWLWSLPWPPALRSRLRTFATSRRVQRLAATTFLVGVVGIIENDAGEILLVRHTYRDLHPWGLPTGWLESGEQPANGLRREIREETGFDVAITDLIDVQTIGARAHLNVIYRGKGAEGDFAASREVSDARFFSIHDLPELDPDDLSLIRTYSREVSAHEAPRIGS